MKKINNNVILTIGILLFLTSLKFDSQINLILKNIRFPIFDAVFGIITNFGVVLFIALVIPSIILYKKNRKSVYLLWLTFIVSVILAFIIKLIILRQRPIGAFAYPLINIINYSFPSMHSMAVFSLLPVLIKHLPKQKSFWAIFALLVAFSRIYFGFHFFSDVIFGAFVGYFVGDFLLELHGKNKLWIN